MRERLCHATGEKNHRGAGALAEQGAPRSAAPPAGVLDAPETETTSIAGLRDRALIGTMVYSFARIGAVLVMKVEDYYPQGKRWWLRLHEKGGKRHDVPCHHTLEQYLDAYCEAAQLWDEKKGPLFRTITVAPGRPLTDQPPTQSDAWRIFVGSDYPGREKFARLTRQEEKAGLFENPHHIGTLDGWKELLAIKHLRLAGHRLVRA